MEQLGGEQLGEDNLLPSTDDLGQDGPYGELQVAPRGAREREADRNPGDLPSAARSRSRSPPGRSRSPQMRAVPSVPPAAQLAPPACPFFFSPSSGSIRPGAVQTMQVNFSPSDADKFEYEALCRMDHLTPDKTPLKIVLAGLEENGVI